MKRINETTPSRIGHDYVEPIRSYLLRRYACLLPDHYR